MEVLDPIPFSLDFEQVAAEAHVRLDSKDATDLIALVDLAQKVGRPRAAFTVCYVEERSGDTVRVDEMSFTSKTMAHNLSSVERVFPFVATCGRELESALPDDSDILASYWWDLIQDHLLHVAYRHLESVLRDRFRLNKTAAMHPGSADVSVWPIEQQANLFTLLGDVEGAIGVQLTDSFLMVPGKSVSGILFPTERDFRSCEVCQRENCPSRVAPFNPALWEEIAG